MRTWPVLLPSLLLLALFAVVVFSCHADYERRCAVADGHLDPSGSLCLTNDGRVIELPA